MSHTRSVFIQERNEPGVSTGRLVTLDDRIFIDDYDPAHPEALWYCDVCETGHPVTAEMEGVTLCRDCLQRAIDGIDYSLANPTPL